MKYRFYIHILTIAFCLTDVLFSYGQSTGIKSELIDTSTTAVIPFNKEKFHPFDSSYKTASLSLNEIKQIDSLLIIGKIGV